MKRCIVLGLALTFFLGSERLKRGRFIEERGRRRTSREVGLICLQYPDDLGKGGDAPKE